MTKCDIIARDDTPRQQYPRIKKQFPNAIVMSRLDDFYETFDDDAKIVSQVCNIVLTGRDIGTGNRVPLAGVPYHAHDNYLAKLVNAGHMVAIVGQTGTEPEGQAKNQRAQASGQIRALTSVLNEIEAGWGTVPRAYTFRTHRSSDRAGLWFCLNSL